jgi:hypothetical protein
MWCVAGNSWLCLIEDLGRAGMTAVTHFGRRPEPVRRRSSESGDQVRADRGCRCCGTQSNMMDADGNVISRIQLVTDA